MRRHRAFTLIELIAVIVVLAVLAGVALPRYFSYRDDALEAADEGALAGITTALNNAHLYHRMHDAAQGQWVTSLNHIPSVMAAGKLPTGLTIEGELLYDQRGNAYFLTAETLTEPARLVPFQENNNGGGDQNGDKSSKAKHGDDNPGKSG